MGEEAGPLPWERRSGRSPGATGRRSSACGRPSARRRPRWSCRGAGVRARRRGPGRLRGRRARPRRATTTATCSTAATPLPDPCSRFQPEGVRGPSRVVDPGAFALDRRRLGRPRPGRPGRLRAARRHVHARGHLRGGGRAPGDAARAGRHRHRADAASRPSRASATGATTASTPGPRTRPTAAPRASPRFVDAAHAAGLGVILDVVYNHLGPGLGGPRGLRPLLHRPPRHALGPRAELRRRRLRRRARVGDPERAHVGARLPHRRPAGGRGARDLRHAAPATCWPSCADRARAAAPRPARADRRERPQRPAHPCAPATAGGWGFDAQWADDFHHALHALLTGERDGYYADFGAVADLAAATRAALRLRRPLLAPSGAGATAPRPTDRAAERFVVCSQNHDQVGNRALGDRPPRARRAPWPRCGCSSRPTSRCSSWARSTARSTPFQFFTDHIDPVIADGHAGGAAARVRRVRGLRRRRCPTPRTRRPSRGRCSTRRRATPRCARSTGACSTLRRELPGDAPPRCAVRRARRRGSACGAGPSRWSATSDDDDAEVRGGGTRAWCWRRDDGRGAARTAALRLPALAGAVVR